MPLQTVMEVMLHLMHQIRNRQLMLRLPRRELPAHGNGRGNQPRRTMTIMKEQPTKLVASFK